MNNNKLRRIILEELSRVQPTVPYRRAQKLGLMDYLGESSDRHLLELDDSTVISTGMSINEDDLLPYMDADGVEGDAGPVTDPAPEPAISAEPLPPTDSAPATPAVVAAPAAPATPAAEPSAAPAASAATADDLDAATAADTGGTDSGGPPEEVAADPDDGSGSERDVDGPGDSRPPPPVEIPTDEDLEQDKLNADVINYIDSISTRVDPAGTSESRSRPIGTSLLKLLYHD